MKVYVIQEVGWEYNDENYYRPESEGGTPIAVYADKAKATAECALMDYEKRKGIDPAHYDYWGKTIFFEVVEADLKE